MKLSLKIIAVFLVSTTSLGCSKPYAMKKIQVYAYKTPTVGFSGKLTEEDVLAIYTSNYDGIAEANCGLLATAMKRDFGNEIRCSRERF